MSLRRTSYRQISLDQRRSFHEEVASPFAAELERENAALAHAQVRSKRQLERLQLALNKRFGLVTLRFKYLGDHAVQVPFANLLARMQPADDERMGLFGIDEMMDLFAQTMRRDSESIIPNVFLDMPRQFHVSPISMTAFANAITTASFVLPSTSIYSARDVLNVRRIAHEFHIYDIFEGGDDEAAFGIMSKISTLTEIRRAIAWALGYSWPELQTRCENAVEKKCVEMGRLPWLRRGNLSMWDLTQMVTEMIQLEEEKDKDSSPTVENDRRIGEKRDGDAFEDENEMTVFECESPKRARIKNWLDDTCMKRALQTPSVPRISHHSMKSILDIENK